LEADVHLELLLPCHMLDSRELVPAQHSLPRPEPEAHAEEDASATRSERWQQQRSSRQSPAEERLSVSRAEK
jgi:hypothetical protein